MLEPFWGIAFVGGDVFGSFLGEYQAGGVIVVLGLEAKDKKIVGFFFLHGNAWRQNVFAV